MSEAILFQKKSYMSAVMACAEVDGLDLQILVDQNKDAAEMTVLKGEAIHVFKFGIRFAFFEHLRTLGGKS